MITFDQLCERTGLEPKAVRVILMSGKPYKINVIPNAIKDEEKAETIKKLLDWYVSESKGGIYLDLFR